MLSVKSLENPIRYFKGVGPKREKFFHKIGIITIEDLLYFFPRRYEDRTKILAIKDVTEGVFCVIKANILAKGLRRSWKNQRPIFELAAADDTGKIFCVWFNQAYLKDYFRVGSAYVLYGRVERYGRRFQMIQPEFEPASESSLNIGRIVPVYSLPEGLPQRVFRSLIKNALDEYVGVINDFLPFDIRSRNNLLNLAKSLLEIHFPLGFDLQKRAFERLSFEEFFLFQTVLRLRKLKKGKKQGIAYKVDYGFIRQFVDTLPFKLTTAQKRVIEEIISDMAKPLCMQRLLQGDVGSGKTIVALISSLIAVQNGYQVAFMAPTEILAKQHYEKIGLQLLAAGSRQKKITVGLVVGSMNKKEKEKTYQEINEGKLDLIIGTHALLEENVKFKKLGLTVIDEQHKFGVGQRALLPQKAVNPDCLIMTATPIPRTLAITLYGDLDISVINELPPERFPVKTLHFTFDDRNSAYELAKTELKKKQQVFIVYPVIDESDGLDIMGAEKCFQSLRDNEFKEFRLGLIHGRIPEDEQDRIMLEYKNRDLDILVCTTILEVGIDIPSATCMIIEYAERFGLSQLHQLRGRVGRGGQESFCLLISDIKTDEAKARIRAMIKYTDGFRIAQEDLKLRGPGEFFGSRQHGLSDLKIANPLKQMQSLKRAREEAIRMISGDPLLQMRQNQLLKEKLLQRFPCYEELMTS